MTSLRLVFGILLVGISCFAMAANTDAAAANQVATTSATAMKAQSSKMVNLNTASAAALAKVKGISMSKAKAIVAYRNQNGSFKSVADLSNVTNKKSNKPLFSDKVITKLQAHLTV